MNTRTLLRPAEIRSSLQRDVIPKALSATVRFPGKKSEATTAASTPGGMLQVDSSSAARRGTLACVEVTTERRLYRFHAEVYGTDSRGVLLDMPRLVEIHQRRSNARQKDHAMRLRLRYGGAVQDVMLADVSAEGVGFLFSELDLPALEAGAIVRARLEERLGEGHALVIEVKTVRPAPGTALTHAGAEIRKMSPAGREWLADRIGARRAG
ncbi:MAG: PilZ domain-containing protein [Proteobacteria bacterium]|nr:PilZ domain-containing protein [Pseudomonadota bacterium]MCP4922153.1 PilZ domain-containing protein [Pseudomonadota bacterium]